MITILLLSSGEGWESNRTYDRTMLEDQSNVDRTDRALMLMGCYLRGEGACGATSCSQPGRSANTNATITVADRACRNRI